MPDLDEVVDLTAAEADGLSPSEKEDVVTLPPEGKEEADTLPANAKLQPDGSVVLTLGRPVVLRFRRSGSDEVRKETRTELHMHRLNGAAMRAVMAAGPGHTVTVGIAHSCRIPAAQFNALYDRMDGADATAAAQVFSYFLSPGASTRSGPPA